MIYGFVPPLPSSLNVCPGMAPHLFVPHDDFRYGLPPDPVIFTKQLLRNRQNSTIAKLRLQWLLPCWSHKWDYARLSANSVFLNVFAALVPRCPRQCCPRSDCNLGWGHSSECRPQDWHDSNCFQLSDLAGSGRHKVTTDGVCTDLHSRAEFLPRTIFTSICTPGVPWSQPLPRAKSWYLRRRACAKS